MTTTSRRSLYKLLTALGQPRLDRGFATTAPDVQSFNTDRYASTRTAFGTTAPLISSSISVDKSAAPVTKISRGQVSALVRDISWISWSVTTRRNVGQDTVEAELRPMNDREFPPLRAKPGAVFSSWVTVPALAIAAALVGLLHLGVVGIIIAILLFGALVGGFFQLAGAPPGLVAIVLMGVTVGSMFVLDARRNRYIRTVHAVDRWLKTAEVRTEVIPREWGLALEDADVHDLIVEWMLSKPEIEALDAHIAEGVKLRKHLPPADPRRYSMQAEIEAQRSKHTALNGLRDARASAITEAAQEYLTQKALARKAELERSRAEHMAQQEREIYQRRWSEINAEEQKRIRAHEQIDGWFDRGSSA